MVLFKKEKYKKGNTILAWAIMTLLCIFLPMIYATVVTIIQKISGKDTKMTNKYHFKQVKINISLYIRIKPLQARRWYLL